MDELDFEVLIVGGSLGGVAAALRAASAGAHVCLLAESEWLGGQMTEQGVSTPDETEFLLRDEMAATASYLFFRQRVREYYRTNHALSAKGKNAQPFCPGDCEVNNGSLSVEPRVAMEILESFLSFSNLTILRNSRATSVQMQGDTIRSVTADVDGTLTLFRAPIVLDATDLGKLLPLAGDQGIDWVIGTESRAETGEPDAPAAADPTDIQTFTFPFMVERRSSGENHTIDQPQGYDDLKRLQKYRVQDGDIHTVFRGKPSWWAYRRVIAAANFNDPAFRHDIAQINNDSNDYLGGVIPTGDPDADRQILEEGRRASLGYLYWMQTECPHDENSAVKGYRELMPRGDLSGSPDGLSAAPYIRESRRIKALKTVVQQEIAATDSRGNPLQTGKRATLFRDSCGIGYYRIDIHPAGPHLGTKPFQIPLGALIPRRITNLIPACKNLGVTHITNGCYRVHPVEWNVGESAGALAAFCAAQNLTPRQVHEDDALLRTFQHRLLQAGIPLFWWPDLSNDHPAFAAAHMLALAGIFEGGDDLSFRADETLSSGDRQILQQVVESVTGQSVSLPSSVRTRGQAAIRIAQELGI